MQGRRSHDRPDGGPTLERMRALEQRRGVFSRLLLVVALVALWAAGPRTILAQEPPAAPAPAKDGAPAPAPTPAPPPSPAPAKAADAPAAPAAPQVPVAPDEPVAARAFAVLDRHCARCHQVGRLKRPSAAGNLADILRLESVAGDLGLVIPGNPDASRLVDVMMLREMPFDVHQEGAAGEGPTGEEIQAVRAWIERLPNAPRCTERTPISMGDVMDAIAGAIAKAPEGAGKDWRFVSLAHLYNDCATETELARYRLAITKLVNSLSWRPEPVVLEPIDSGGTVLRLSLSAAGWVGAHWEMLGYANPYGFVPDTKAAAKVAEITGTAMPVVRGDWLARAAGQAPLYYDLLGVPTRWSELMKVLGQGDAAGADKRPLRRAGILGSNVTRSQRLLERVGRERGLLWRTFDFVRPPSSPVDLIETPLPLPAPKGFQHELALAMFTLPNGLPAYYVSHAAGQRLDAVPGLAIRHKVTRDGAVPAGAPCMACHGQGLRPFRDDLRANVVGEARFDRELQDMIASLHPPSEEMQAVIDADVRTLAAAWKAAGIDPSVTIRDLEPITGLARHYARRLDFARLAAELGFRARDLDARLKEAPAPVKRIVARLQQGTLDRQEIEAAQALIAPHVGFRPASVTAGVAPVKSAESTDRFLLTLLADRPGYRVGELVTFTVATTRDCNLTVISLDKSGRATVIFPNEFEPRNALAAGRELKLPGERAPYQFRAKEAGRERVIAICNAANGWAEGITHDYERQRFTVLGDYAEFVAKSDAGGRPVDPRGPAARRRPGGPANGEADARPAAKDLARTAITIDIR